MIDAQDPMFSGCPTNIEVNNDAGECGAIRIFSAIHDHILVNNEISTGIPLDNPSIRIFKNKLKSVLVN